MADQTIADLPLISAVTSDISFPTDNGIITYRATAAQIKDFVLANGNVLLAALDDDIFHGLTEVTPAADDYFTLVDTSDSNKTKKGLVSTFVKSAYAAVSSFPYSISVSDELIKFSSTSGTATLPTAVGVAGKRYKLQHAGTSLTQVYTLATTSSQTIGGIAGGSYALYTNGETLNLESDGANWLVIDHKTRNVEADAGALTITSSGGGVVKGTTTHETFLWSRDGADCVWRWDGKWAAGTQGTGDYMIAFPTGLTADTTNMHLNTSALGATITGGILQTIVGHGFLSSSVAHEIGAYLYSSSLFKALVSGTGAWAGGNAGNLGNATSISIQGRHRVTGWQP